MNTSYQQNIAYRLRKIGNQNILVGENQYYELNEVANEIWFFLEQKRTIDEVINYINKEFNVDKKTLNNDIHLFIEEMIKNNTIKVEYDEC